MRFLVRRAAIGAVTLLFSGCSPDRAIGTWSSAASMSGARVHTDASARYRYSYIVVGSAGSGLPATLDADIQAAGGTLTAAIPQIGLAVVESDRDDFADVPNLRGTESVFPDLPMAVVDAAEPMAHLSTDGLDAGPVSVMTGAPPIPAGGDPLSGLQWALGAIHAPEAWALGLTGRGVRVAVLDAGIQATHVDLAANLNTGLSTSFVPGQTFGVPPALHGTEVSGIIAAARNDRGTVGVAPNAELVMVKILAANGTGPISRFAQGIVYAADIGARVANISAGTNLPRATQIVVDDRGTPDPNDDVRIRFTNTNTIAVLRALGRATNYAHAKGMLIVAAAGNLAKDFDHAQSDIGIPQELPHVITIGPTGPLGWALDPNTDLDVRPSYANYGSSYLSLVAPGGNFDVFTRPGLPTSCTLLTFTWPCQVFDIILTTGLGSTWVWAFGGSLAAPHVAGVAALLFEKLGSSATPDQVESILRRTADDLGKPGNDDFYAHGRVNAHRAAEWK